MRKLTDDEYAQFVKQLRDAGDEPDDDIDDIPEGVSLSELPTGTTVAVFLRAKRSGDP